MSEKIPGKPSLRYPSLDLIRSIAITFLIIAHVGQRLESSIGKCFGLPGFYYVSLGGVAVTIFIVLSGIALECNYGKIKIAYGEFMVRRMLRIYPIYYLTLALGFSLYAIRCFSVEGEWQSPFLMNVIYDLFCILTGTYIFFGHFSTPFLGTSWFIGLIMFLYLFYPFLAKAICRHPILTLASLLIATILSRIILGQYPSALPDRALDWFPPCRVFEFGLGIWLGRVIMQRKEKEMRNGMYLSRIFGFLSEVSFPLFLVHYPLLFIVTRLVNMGWPSSASIIIYLLISLGFSTGVLWWGNRIAGLIIDINNFRGKARLICPGAKS